MLCQYCEGLTIDKLLGLAKKHEVAENYISEAFPRNASCSYFHHPSFKLLLRSSREGCELCHAIETEFERSSDLMSRIEAKSDTGLDTSIRICIAVRDKESEEPDKQVFDRLLASVGFDEDDDDMNDDNANDSVVDSSESPDDFYDDLAGSLRELPEGYIEEDSTESDPDESECMVLFSLTRHKDASPQLHALRVGLPYMGAGLDSQENFDLARNWLRICIEQHRGDCPPMRDHLFPTRVVDIGPPEMPMSPKIYVSAGDKGMYVALSHCWGNTMPVKTTRASLDSHIRALPMKLLPRNFQDAMKITRQLGFRYLWIDSLCIIQDDPQDWDQESAVMDSVYKNAVITIAAAAGGSCDSGILNPWVYEDKSFERYCFLRLHPASSLSESVQLSTFKGEEHFENLLYALPLAQRGWPFQERLLSRRVLYYGEHQIYFQCRTAHLSADGIPPKDFYTVKSVSSALLTLPRATTSLWGGAKHLEVVYDMWLTIVRTYCNYRHLTYPSDKFPALAGIASEFQKSIGGDTYLAGIWRSDFPRGLLWHTFTDKIALPGLLDCGIFPEVTGPVLQLDRAPSWSWARWDGVIHFPVQYARPVHNAHLVQLLDHKIRRRWANLFGEVLEGTLRLRGWVAEMDLDRVHSLGEVRLDSPQPSDEQLEYKVLFVGAFLDHKSLSLFTHTTRHEPLQEIRWKGMLLLRPADLHDDVEPKFERVGAVFNREDTHGVFGFEGWRVETVVVV